MERYAYRHIILFANTMMILCFMGISIPKVLKWSMHQHHLMLCLFCLIHFIVGVCISVVDVPIMTVLHQTVDPKMLGRVSGTTTSIVKGIYPLGLGLSGFIMAYLSPYEIPLIGSLIMFLFSLYFYMTCHYVTSCGSSLYMIKLKKPDKNTSKLP